MYSRPSVWYSGRSAVPGGSITLAARTAATALAFNARATAAARAAGGLSVLADDGATADSDPASATAATIRTLISEPPGLPVKGDAARSHLYPSAPPSGAECRRSSRRAGPPWPGVRMFARHAGPQERSTGGPTGLRRVPDAPRAWQWSIVSVPFRVRLVRDR